MLSSGYTIFLSITDGRYGYQILNTLGMNFLG
jgi:hypothetical protein